jgi:hypothetical protein
MEPTLSVKLKVMPGITKDISITLTDLVTAFNTVWSLDDRLKLIMGLDLDGETVGMDVIAAIINGLDLDDLSEAQVLIIDSAINRLSDRIQKRKLEFIKERQNV